jgi:nucleoside triphosphatase
MPADRGVFPGQWALSGGGLEAGESIEEGLRREICEELGEKLEITDVRPWTFRDDTRIKTHADGSIEEIYMIYLIFDCSAANREIELNDEFEDYAWVRAGELASFDLNTATLTTLMKKGLIQT